MRTLIRLAPIALALAVGARAESFYLNVAGLGGEEQYEQRFSGWASDLAKLLKNEPGAKVETLSGKDATKANIEAKLRSIAQQSKPDDTFVLMLMGHGTYDDIDYKFNIPGTDISAFELGALLDKIPARQAVILATSSSGAAIPTLQKAKRVVITATKSGTEKNATIFARFWVEALRDPGADTDKNEVVTALEAFEYAQLKTKNYFETQKHLATENSLIEDTGKGDGVKAASSENGEGLLAKRINILHLGSVASIVNNPEKQKLLKRKDELETAIDELKYRKAAMESTQYRRQLQQMLLELAQVQGELDK